MKKTVGDRIRRIRVSQNYTQENIADELKMSSGAYSKIERGTTDVQVSRLYSIAKILKVNVIDFFLDKKEPVFAEDPLKQYGLATKGEIEELTQSIRDLQQEVEKLKNKMTEPKRRGSKRKK